MASEKIPAGAVAVAVKESSTAVVRIQETVMGGGGIGVSAAFACGSEFPQEATVMSEDLYDPGMKFVGVCVSICNGFVYRASTSRDSADARMCDGFRRYVLNTARQGNLERLLEPMQHEMHRMFRVVTHLERDMVDIRGGWDKSDTHAAVIVVHPIGSSHLSVTVAWVGNGGILSYDETLAGGLGWRVPRQTMYVCHVDANQFDLSTLETVGADNARFHPGVVKTATICMPNIVIAPGQAFIFTTDGHRLITVDEENHVLELTKPITGGDTATVDMMTALIDAGAKGNCTVVRIFARSTL